MQDRSLGLLTSSPERYHCTWDAPSNKVYLLTLPTNKVYLLTFPSNKVYLLTFPINKLYLLTFPSNKVYLLTFPSIKVWIFSSALKSECQRYLSAHHSKHPPRSPISFSDSNTNNCCLYLLTKPLNIFFSNVRCTSQQKMRTKSIRISLPS